MKIVIQRYQTLLTFFARLLIGSVLLAAGGLKAFEPSQAANAMAAYKILPTKTAHILGYALPWLEIAIGVLLIIGVSVRMFAAISSVLMGFFIAAIISIWARGILIDCGCFGGGGEIDPIKAAEVHRKYAIEIARDFGLALTAIYLYFFPYGVFAVEKLSKENEEN